ncbi:hypothetical protein AV530_009233 [Patagioenas fasciata monilis]|uniref:Uncharacterized protein n=1 Tax=Patagioenas fasciata monilis TaxID=372326 RepID=A0A1V4KMM8_PATFA|nr:hypothetical protein AV530_009233 [Patagioenas fasciata monilis]
MEGDGGHGDGDGGHGGGDGTQGGGTQGDDTRDGGDGTCGLLERLSVTVTALRGQERPGDNAEQWRAVEVARTQEKEKVSGLERTLGTLRARAGQLASACRDKDATMKKLLMETEKLSAEVLGLRGQNARLQLQLEVQEKNHRDIVAVYRTHLLHAAQGFMDEGVHAMLLRILRTGEWGAGSGPLPSPPPSH